MDMRFRVLKRPPSDTLALVEIDPYSLRKEERWPWPRDRYADAISNLQNAGASLIGFDIDFSSLADEEGDAALAAALSNQPGEVVLPIFSQWSNQSDSKRVIIETPPA